MQILNLVAKLEAANTAYRNGTPLMSDEEYTALEDQLRLLDSAHPFLDKLADDAAPAALPVAGDSDLSRFNREEALSMPMGSQQKALSLDDPDLAKFERETGETEWFWSDKVDGASAELTYVDGKFTQALTRGDGKIGVNFTVVAREIPGIPKSIPQLGKVVVRGEVCMPKSHLALANADLQALGRDPLQNTRNGTVAVMKTLKNLMLAKHLDFLAFNLLIVSA